MGEQLLRIIAGLFVGIWVARYLGPEQFGIFSYALAFTAIFGGIAKLGLDGIMVRELVNNPENRGVYLGTAFWLKILGAFIVIGLMAAIVPFTSNDATTNLFIFIIASGLVFQSFEVVEFYFQSQVLAKIVSICKVIQLALSSMIKIYLVLSESELIWFVLVTAFDALSLAVSYFIAYKIRKNPAFYRHFDFGIAKQLLKDSWPLIFSAIVVMIYMRIDQIMIKEILGLYEVGIYSAAMRLIEATYFIPAIIVASLFPSIISAKSKSEELYLRRIRRLYFTFVWTAIVIAVLIFFLSEQLIDLLFGSSYSDSTKVLQAASFLIVLIFISAVHGKWLITEGLQKFTIYYSLVAVSTNVLLNLFFIPDFGVVGAVYASLLSQILPYGVLIWYKKTRAQFFMIIESFNIFIFRKVFYESK
ncbi:MAG: flippase [Methyloprofundus sp.]|nr:flippase [Methyloprofundus sp.]